VDRGLGSAARGGQGARAAEAFRDAGRLRRSMLGLLRSRYATGQVFVVDGGLTLVM
jgi:hypothetical protein